MPHGLDRGRPQLLAQPPDANLDDVRARIEVVPPDIGEQLLTTADLAVMPREMPEQLELAVGQVGHVTADPCGAPCEVELERPGAENELLVFRHRATQLHAYSRHELVECERLRR